MVFEERFPDGLWIVVGDWLASGWVDQCGDIGEPSFKEVAEFGNGADGGARCFDGVGLLDRNGGADVFDRIDFGAIHQIHELTSVGREGLYIAALAFGMQRLEYQRGFTCSAKTGDDCELTDG
ncbi:hypothetical protein [Lentimonas sp. CC4]|uniref:hypothetical protein n=1 Tax=Lentimonas sp. CC4 TaxID=2676099 RepID=UPI001328D0DB|nr:hypothetical protein [Lentimonas sp. CC4]CAA6676882.1 Unannotated [Lentimonas sp. CC4]